MGDDKTPSPAGNHPDTVGPWRIGRTVGRDRVFPIRIARHLESDTYTAVKIVPFSRFSRSPYLEVSSDTLSDLEHELAMMKLICHPNILALYDVWESQRETFVITEYTDGGDVFAHLQQNNIHELSALATYFRQIMSTVAYCHSLNVTFHGLQADSLQLDEAKEMIKLISFDTATLETDTFSLTLGKRKDIWSCTVILFKLLSGQFDLDVEMESWAQFSPPSNRTARPPELPDTLAQPAKDIFDAMLMSRNRNLKLTPISELITYSFFDLASGLAIKTEHVASPQQTADLTAKMIDFNTYKELRVLLLHRLPEKAIQKNLLKKGPSFEKTVYSLLALHRLKGPYYSEVCIPHSQSPGGIRHLQASSSAAAMTESSRRIPSCPTTPFRPQGAPLRVSSSTTALPSFQRERPRRHISAPRKQDLDSFSDTSLLGLGILRHPVPSSSASNRTIDHNDCQAVDKLTVENDRITQVQNVPTDAFNCPEGHAVEPRDTRVETRKTQGTPDNPPPVIGIISPPTLHPKFRDPPRKVQPRRLVKAKPTTHSHGKSKAYPSNLTHELPGFRNWLGLVIPGMPQISASLLSVQDIRTTRAECIRLLQTFDVFVDPNTTQKRTLRCELTYMPYATHNYGTRKHLHFTVKFSHVTSRSHVRTGFVSSLRLIKRKGSTALFKHVYNRLRHEWDLDNLSVVKEESLTFGIVPSPAIVFSQVAT